MVDRNQKGIILSCYLDKVIVNGGQEITELVKGTENQVLRNIDDNWNFTFLK